MAKSMSDRTSGDRILIDTVFVVALINIRDQYHSQAIQWSQQIEGANILVTDAVLLEVGNQLARSHRAEAAQIIEDFLTSSETEVVHLTPGLFVEALAMYKNFRDKTWSLVDCISFVVMKRSGIEKALTADHHFTQAGFQALMSDGTGS